LKLFFICWCFGDLQLIYVDFFMIFKWVSSIDAGFGVFLMIFSVDFFVEKMVFS